MGSHIIPRWFQEGSLNRSPRISSYRYTTPRAYIELLMPNALRLGKGDKINSGIKTSKGQGADMVTAITIIQSNPSTAVHQKDSNAREVNGLANR